MAHGTPGPQGESSRGVGCAAVLAALLTLVAPLLAGAGPASRVPPPPAAATPNPATLVQATLAQPGDLFVSPDERLVLGLEAGQPVRVTYDRIALDDGMDAALAAGVVPLHAALLQISPAADGPSCVTLKIRLAVGELNGDGAQAGGDDTGRGAVGHLKDGRCAAPSGQPDGSDGRPDGRDGTGDTSAGRADTRLPDLPKALYYFDRGQGLWVELAGTFDPQAQTFTVHNLDLGPFSAEPVRVELVASGLEPPESVTPTPADAPAPGG